MIAALEGGEWSASRLGRNLPPGKDPVPILQEAGWATGPVWAGGKSRPHCDSIPDCPARSQSLYRLCYPAHALRNSYCKFWNLKAYILTYFFFGKVEILMKTLLKTQSLQGCYAMSTGKQFPTFRRSVLPLSIGLSLNIYESTLRAIPENLNLFGFSFIWRSFRSL